MKICFLILSINTRKDSAYDLSSAKERAMKMLSDKFVKSVSIFNHDNLVWTKRNSAYESLNESILKYDDSSFRLIKGDVDFENYIKTNVDNFDIRAVALKNNTPIVYYLVGNAFDFNHLILIKKFVEHASIEDVKPFILDYEEDGIDIEADSDYIYGEGEYEFDIFELLYFTKEFKKELMDSEYLDYIYELNLSGKTVFMYSRAEPNLNILKDNLVREIKESLNEASKKGPIVDEKILNYFYECVDRLYELKFWDNDFCLHYELIKLEYGEYINTFGEYQWPNEPKGEGTIVLNIHMFNEPEEAIKNTIYHELAHYIVFKWGLQKGIYKNVSWGKWTYSQEASKYSKSDWTSHGKVWQSVADKIGRAVGMKISRVDSFNTHTGVGAYAEQSYKYIFKCKHCGNIFKYSKSTQFVDSVLKNKGHSPTWWCCCKDGFKGRDFEIIKSE